jgi:cation transport ATPase
MVSFDCTAGMQQVQCLLSEPLDCVWWRLHLVLLTTPTTTGPGRDIITHGFTALAVGRPDMNTLVGLGATTSFAVSCVAAAVPKLGWRTFFEEPSMLLGACVVKRGWGVRACGWVWVWVWGGMMLNSDK